MNLTPKQERVLDAMKAEGGTVTEDYLFEFVTRPRIVLNALEKKGLIRFGDYWGDEHGYEVHLREGQ